MRAHAYVRMAGPQNHINLGILTDVSDVMCLQHG